MFLKDFFEKCQQTTKHEKLPSMQRIKNVQTDEVQMLKFLAYYYFTNVPLAQVGLNIVLSRNDLINASHLLSYSLNLKQWDITNSLFASFFCS